MLGILDDDRRAAVARANARVEERFRLLVESLTDCAVFMIDLSGTIASWNAGVEIVLGYEPDEFVGLPFASIFTPEDIALGRPVEELERVLTSGRSDDTRTYVRKDGSRFPADGVVSAIRDKAGHVDAFFKVIHDASAQRRASEALRESEERYRLLIENVRDHAIFLLDPGGHVASWAPEAERMKGYRADEIIGQHFRVFFTQEDQRRGLPEQELRTADDAEGWRVRTGRDWGDEIWRRSATKRELRGLPRSCASHRSPARRPRTGTALHAGARSQSPEG